MEDLRLYHGTEEYDHAYTQEDTSERMGLAMSDEAKATDLEVIAGKVTKFMLTSRGSDAFDPNYGGVSMHHRQISQAYIPQLVFEVRSDIENCLAYITDSDNEHCIDAERLVSIRLLDVKYDPILHPTRVDVFIEIATNYGNKAVVSLSSKDA